MARKACNYMTAAVEECGDELIGDCYSEEDVINMKDHQLKNVLEVLEKSVEEWDTDKCEAVKAHVERVKRLDNGGDEDFDNDGIMNDEDEDDDNDGIVDDEDKDDDNDGVLDSEDDQLTDCEYYGDCDYDGESMDSEVGELDSDNDGIPDDVDADDDNDGIPDEEDSDDDSDDGYYETDDDDIPDEEDNDDDNDGNPDEEYEEEDTEEESEVSEESFAGVAGLSFALLAIGIGCIA